jgi:hypothetical protein
LWEVGFVSGGPDLAGIFDGGALGEVAGRDGWISAFRGEDKGLGGKFLSMYCLVGEFSYTA